MRQGLLRARSVNIEARSQRHPSAGTGGSRHFPVHSSCRPGSVPKHVTRSSATSRRDGRENSHKIQAQGRTEVVLLSGGMDSTTALALACSASLQVSALFVDYGQSSASSEAAAAAAVADHYSVPYRILRLAGLSFSAGEIRGRNALLVHCALVAFPAETGIVIIGIHGGTSYRDCNPDFVTLMQRSFDFHCDGRLAIAAPFADQLKGDVYNLALQLKAPLALTYSCEAGNVPCGRCLSCRDREALLARP